MSSQQPFNTPAPALPGVRGAAGAAHKAATGEIQHIHYLSEHIGALFLNDEYSDVTLVVDGHRFDAHKVILAARSEYFRALLYGGMLESAMSEIELKDTPLGAFKHLLRYIYTGQMSLAGQRDDLVLEVLGLAHQYGFQDLERAVSDHLRAVLCIANVCLIYDTAALYQLADLVSSCSLFMDRHATEIIKHESFTSMSMNGVRDILSRDSFCAPEVDIFRAVHDWVRANPGEADYRAVLGAVRLSLMATNDLLQVVRPTGLVSPDIMLDAIQSRTQSRDMELKYRGYLIPEENIAQPKHGAQVLLGEVKHALLDGDTKNYDMERGFSRHPIDETQPDKGIVIKLGMQCIINNIKMLLWDRDQRAYSYYIDVSMDQHDWARVVDHTRYHCRSWQNLYFRPRVARYIRVVGTHNSVNKVFHVVALEAYFTKDLFRLDETFGVLIPRDNVATISHSASVIEGVCRSRNALLNGDTSNYDWDSGYTCHQLGSGAIIVQLGQPYAIGCMRLLLWDCDDRSYSYFVEVSVNLRDWDVVCDRSRENCKSWQTITFPRRPVVYIKIVGTHNTANEVFHCVHFECPAVTEGSEGNAVLAAVVKPSPRPRSPSPSSTSSSSATEESASDENPAPPNDAEDDPTNSASHLSTADTISVASAVVMGAVGGAVSTKADSVVAAAANLSFDDGAASVASHRSSPTSYAGSNSSQIPVGSSANSLANRRRSQQLSGASSIASSSVGPSQWPGGMMGFAQFPEDHHNLVNLPGQIGAAGAAGPSGAHRSVGGVAPRHVAVLPNHHLSQQHLFHNHPQSPASPTSSHSSPSRAYYEEDHFHLPVNQAPVLAMQQPNHNQQQLPSQGPQVASQPPQAHVTPQQHQPAVVRPPSPTQPARQQLNPGPSAATGAIARRRRHCGRGDGPNGKANGNGGGGGSSD